MEKEVKQINKKSNKKNNKSFNDLIKNLEENTEIELNEVDKKEEENKKIEDENIEKIEPDNEDIPIKKTLDEEQDNQSDKKEKKNNKDNIKINKIKKSKKKKIIIIFFLLLFITIIAVSIYKYFDIKNNIIFELNGDSELTIEVGSEYEEQGFIAKIKNKDVSSKAIVEGEIDNKKIGDYEISYSLYLKYLNYKKNLTRTIHVKDTKKPELNINGDKEISVYVGETVNNPTYNAYDEYDGDLTDKVNVESNVDTSTIGTYEIKYTVSDSSENISTDTVIVHIIKKPKNAYINISISEQKLYYYEYGKLVIVSDVVTGQYGVSPTPYGTYKVLNKARNINLIGANYVAFVNYWIAFIGSSYGMHDASWKGVFGGDEYKRAGSHGCVNMPLDKIKQLYALVDVGTPVYIY